MQYRLLGEDQYYIDKTRALEQGIQAFSSIFLEGAAASGKTTAVNMLLARHPEVTPIIFWMDREMREPEIFRERLESIRSDMVQNLNSVNSCTYSLKSGEYLEKSGKTIWVIFENLWREIPQKITELILEFLRDLSRLFPGCRAILIGRERPWEGLLEFYWKREMEFLPQSVLLFTKEEIQILVEQTGSGLNPDEIYEETGGWAGCVDMMIRLEKRGDHAEKPKILRSCYEIDNYIQREIIETLSPQEQELMRRGAICPWLNEELCTEIWGISYAKESLESLRRKGLLVYDERQKQWKLARLFQKNYQSAIKKEQKQNSIFWKHLGNWYESHGFIKDALECLKRTEDTESYRACLITHFNQVPFLEISYSEVMKWKENTPEICYLRGMYCYSRQNLEGLNREVRKLEKLQNTENCKSYSKEILLNLYYVKPDLQLNRWMDLLEKNNGEKMHLYSILGNSYTYLCGLRDLTGLFFCTKKEENRMAQIWKENLGFEEWKAYRLARLDYYLETERRDSIREEDWDLLMSEVGKTVETWQFLLVRLYLLYKLQEMDGTINSEVSAKICRLEDILVHEDHEVCIRNTEAISCIYSFRGKGQEKLARWLRCSCMDNNFGNIEISEENYAMFCCQARGYLYLNQYEKAEKILHKVIPWLQFYQRSRLLAECFFARAIANWGEERHTQALRSIIESFLISRTCRYVGFYTRYGKMGKVVLDAYAEWMRNNTPERWHRKKKYNYGNVLRMPMEDYVEVILRQMKREIRANPGVAEQNSEERLTMMETIVLHNIDRGLSNEEIGKELNLKLTTVKSHIYNLYKKLGVNNRVQAVRKGKELGILE